MLNSLSRILRGIGKVAAESSKYHLKEIKLFFSAPKQASEEHSLTIKDVPADQANFQWISFQVLFSTEKLNYYVYSMPLETNGKGKPPAIVFDSDDDWSGKNKDTPSKDITPGEVERAFPKVFRGPNLFPADSVPFGVPSNYINAHSSDKGRPYSSTEFEDDFDNDFYIVLDPKSKKLENPFGTHVEPVGKTYPEKEETPEEGK